MNMCLEVAYEQVASGCHEVNDKMPDILDTDVVMKDADSDKKFYQELKRFIKKHENQLKVGNVHRRIRNAPKNEELMGTIKNEISNYITGVVDWHQDQVR